MDLDARFSQNLNHYHFNDDSAVNYIENEGLEETFISLFYVDIISIKLLFVFL